MEFEVSNKNNYKINNITQIKAIITICLQRQVKRKWINLFLLITPILILIFLLYIKYMIQDLNKKLNDLNNFQSFPLYLNIPFYNLINSNLLPFKVSDCNLWFSYKLNKNINKSFFKQIIKKQFKEYCDKIKKYVPIFKESKRDLKKKLIKQITELENEDLDMGKDLKNIHILPDGAYEVDKFNNNEIDMNIWTNDLLLFEMHRSNGFSKMKFSMDNNVNKNEFSSLKEDVKKVLNNTENGNKNIFVDKYKKIMVEKYGGINLISPNNAFLSMWDYVTKSFLKNFNPKIELLTSYIYMNSYSSAKFFIDAVYGVLLGSIWPLVFGALLPTFISFLVYDRVEKILVMIRIHGLKIKNYYAGMIIFFIFLYLIQILFIWVFIYLFLDFQFFIQTNIALIFLILFLWGLNQIGLSLILQNFLNSNGLAFIFGYIISISLLIVSVYINVNIYTYPFNPPIFMYFIPQISFSRLFLLLNLFCIDDKCVTSIQSNIKEVNLMIKILFITSILYILLGIFIRYFLDNINYFLNLLKCNYKLKRKLKNKENKSSLIVEEDDSCEIEVENEKKKIKNMNLIEKKKNYSLIINKISKTFIQNNKYVKACKKISFTLTKNNIFCLLGPNGAGKTTLQSILTGIYKPDKGSIFMNEKNIDFKKEIYNQNIGVCPQYDLLWDDLTIKEHLNFYCKIRGINNKVEINNKVDNILEEVLLTEHQHKRVDMLSGGLKRRLSIAISAVGDIDIIFLDEPTTGLDPKIRKNIWEILLNLKKTKSMILNTHLMEEAEILGDQISIILKGSLKTLGTSEYLKNKYCNYIKLLVNFKNNHIKEENTINVLNFWKNYYNIEIVHEYKSTILIKIYQNKIFLNILKEFIKEKNNLNYNNYSIFKSNLKDVFEYIYNKYN